MSVRLEMNVQGLPIQRTMLPFKLLRPQHSTHVAEHMYTIMLVIFLLFVLLARAPGFVLRFCGGIVVAPAKLG